MSASNENGGEIKHGHGKGQEVGDSREADDPAAEIEQVGRYGPLPVGK